MTFTFSLISSCSGGDGELSELEVSSLLGSLDGSELLLFLGESSSGSLGSLGSEVLGSVLLVLPGVLGSGSSLLVEDSENSGNGLSDNLKYKM